MPTKGEGLSGKYRLVIAALILNVPLICLILFLDIGHIDLSFFSFIYVSCTILGYYILPLLLIVSIFTLSYFIHRRLPAILTGIVAVIFIYYLIIDYFIYTNTKIHLDLFWLEWILNDREAFGLPSGTFRNLFFVLLSVIILQLGIFKLAKIIRKPRFFALAFAVLVPLAFGVSQTIHIFAYDKNYHEITDLTPRLPVYYPIISRKHAVMYEDLFPVFEKKTEPATAGYESSMKYPLRPLEFDRSPDTEPPNIVMLFLESWRTDMMDRVTTPNIYALSRKSSVFLNHFCSGNSTVAGVIGPFCGIHPTYWTAIKANSVLIDNPVLIDVLKDNGYSFGIYAKSNFVRHKIKDTIFRGIDVNEDFEGGSIVEQDADMTHRIISFLRKQKEGSNPFMVFAFFKSDHFPYHYPDTDSLFLPAENLNFMLTTADTDPEEYINDARNSHHYVDGLIGDILSELDTLGYMDNTIIIVTTDHSDELNDNRENYWGHGTNFTRYQIRVPLVFYIPGRKPQEIKYITAHIDIPPTILQEFFGCKNDVRDYSNGRNLFDKQEGIRPLVVGGYVNHAFVIGDNVYEIYPMYTKKYKLNDITKKASSPSPEAMSIIKEQINRFYLRLALNSDN
jgi:membrane-anchored protein YejM (alkaline phosphatase superfamily)